MESMKKKNTANSRECSVCGDEAAYCFYGAIVCDSCRAFFRRSVIRAKQQVTCRRLKKTKANSQNYSNHRNDTLCDGNNELRGQCDVSVSNRKFCSKCRMDKCILVGMKKEHVFILKGNSNCNPSSQTLESQSQSSSTRTCSSSSSSTSFSPTSSSHSPSPPPLSQSPSSPILGGGVALGDQKDANGTKDTREKKELSTDGDEKIQSHQPSAISPAATCDCLEGKIATASGTSTRSDVQSNKNCKKGIHFQVESNISQAPAQSTSLVAFVQSKCNIGLDLSLNFHNATFTRDELQQLQLFSTMAEYCRQRPLEYPNQLSDEETIFYISKTFTERLVFVFGEMTPFLLLPFNIQCEICQLFVPLCFIIKSFIKLKEDGNLNILSNIKTGDLSLLPPEIYIPVKVSYRSNPCEYEKIINFLQRYAEVMQSTPKCLFKDFRIILVTYTYLLYEYLSEREQKLAGLPQLRHTIYSNSESARQFFKKLATVQYGGDAFKQILKVLPQMTNLTELFGSLTLAPAKTAIGPN